MIYPVIQSISVWCAGLQRNGFRPNPLHWRKSGMELFIFRECVAHCWFNVDDCVRNQKKSTFLKILHILAPTLNKPDQLIKVGWLIFTGRCVGAGLELKYAGQEFGWRSLDHIKQEEPCSYSSACTGNHKVTSSIPYEMQGQNVYPEFALEGSIYQMHKCKCIQNMLLKPCAIHIAINGMF